MEEEFEVEFDSWSLNRKRFGIQILVAILVALHMYFFIFPFILNPLLAIFFPLMVFPNSISSISMWFFAFSCAYFIYPDNKILNNYLFCALFPLSYIVVFEWFGFFFWDFFHLLPIIIAFYILSKHSEQIKISHVAIIQAGLVFWYVLVNSLGLNNYPTFHVYHLLIWYGITVGLAIFVRVLVVYREG